MNTTALSQKYSTVTKEGQHSAYCAALSVDFKVPSPEVIALAGVLAPGTDVNNELTAKATQLALKDPKMLGKLRDASDFLPGYDQNLLVRFERDPKDAKGKVFMAAAQLNIGPRKPSLYFKSNDLNVNQLQIG